MRSTSGFGGFPGNRLVAAKDGEAIARHLAETEVFNALVAARKHFRREPGAWRWTHTAHAGVDECRHPARWR